MSGDPVESGKAQGAAPLPPKPEPPHPDSCCGRGCDPCIFDYYERALARWEEAVRARQGRDG